MKRCEVCGFETDNGKVFANHIRWQHKYQDKNSPEFKRMSEKIKAKRLNNPTGMRIVSFKDSICPRCGKEFQKEIWTNSKTGKVKIKSKFCSRSCANSRVFSEEANLSRSLKAKANPSGCRKPGWTAKSLARKNHSKRELEIVDFFKSNFQEDDWKVGLIDGSKRHNGILLNPDLWSKKLKVVIEYGGIWHFTDIHNQLEHKQKVDIETVKWCKENGYRLIRIDEKSKISNDQIKEAVYNKKETFICFGSERYSYLQPYI